MDITVVSAIPNFAWTLLTPTGTLSAGRILKRARFEPPHSNLHSIERMDQPAKKQRATWKRSEERLLLQCYLGARNDATLRSDKGIKSKG
ncbi:hypothetical protein GQ600_17555 [Phytophthora cactorum]|nr:hypothetical protein GQ600_10016 [Phytophthora cactorum]KAF1775906.1 hypothetical protein GQ600_17555 [Phytophthora cactorum]